MAPAQWCRFVGVAAMLAAGCRESAVVTVVADDAATLVPGDAAEAAVTPTDAASSDATAIDAFLPLDAPFASDRVVPVDARGVDAGRDAARRDAPPACVCPPLPVTCTPPRVDAPSFSPERDLLTQVLAFVSCANRTLDIALYETEWSCLPEAIRTRLDAAPELNVRIVVDDEDCPPGMLDGGLACPIRTLAGHPRVSIVSDERSALMHHKFMVADGAQLWVGSANSSQQSYCVDANDALVIAEPAIVDAYEAEFLRMFRDRAFGPLPAMEPVTAGIYTAYFSPRSPTTGPSRWFSEMLTAINNARVSVDFVISAWTRPELSDAMLAARRRGVRVRGIVAPNYLNDLPAMTLRAAGVTVRVGDVHSKLLLVDDQLVVTGSANWSASAWANNENSLWVRDANVALDYTAFFTRAWEAASVPVADRDR